MKVSHVLGAVIGATIVFWGSSCFFNSQRQEQARQEQARQEQYRKAIIYVLEQDKLADDGISSVAEYVKNQSSISLNGCPPDFTMAYRKHQAAWQDMKSVEEEAEYFKKRYNSGEAFLEAFLRGMILDFSLLGDSDEAAKRLNNHHQSAKKAIRNTFHEVLNIAESYGVETTPYR